MGPTTAAAAVLAGLPPYLRALDRAHQLGHVLVLCGQQRRQPGRRRLSLALDHPLRGLVALLLASVQSWPPPSLPLPPSLSPSSRTVSWCTQNRL